MKRLLKQNKEEEALKLFVKIKQAYHDPVPKEVFEDKERLKKEISALYESFEKDSKAMTNKDNAITNEKQEDKKTLKVPLPKKKEEK